MSVAIGPYLTTEEAAERLGVSPSRVRQFVMQRRIKSHPIGSMRFFLREDVERFAKEKRPTGRPRKRILKKLRPAR